METLFDPWIVLADVGTSVCLVMEMKGCSSDSSLEGIVVSSGQRIFVDTSLPLRKDERATLYFWKVSEIYDDGSVLLVKTNQSKAHPCGIVSEVGMKPPVVSMCSGMGGIVMGAKRAGFETLAAVDHSPKAKELLEANFGFPVFLGQVGDLEVIEAVHAHIGGQSCLLESGFPCQPYSRLGDGRGFADDRAYTLIEILRAGWLLQVQGLVLECVGAAGQDPNVRHWLQLFVTKIGAQCVDQVLRLDRFWPTRRTRWWFLAFPSHWPSFDFADLPKGPFNTVEELIPCWPVWPLVDELALKWTDEEEQCFRDARFGATDRTINMKGKFPTILHSCGCHFRPCPCQCRSKGFNEARLLQGGLHCPEIRSMHDPSFSRYPHPEELGLLHGVDIDYKYGNLKDSLCMLGQIASPWQSLWCFLHLGGLHADLDEHCSLAEYATTNMLLEGSDLQAQSLRRWATAENEGARIIQVNVVSEPSYNVKIAKRTSIGELVAGHAKVSRTETMLAFNQGCALRLGDFLHDDITLVQNELPSVPDLVQVTFSHGDCCTLTSGASGSFLFDLADSAGFDHVQWTFQEEAGDRLVFRGKDFIVTKSCKFRLSPVIHGGGSRPHEILGVVLADPHVLRWHQENRLDGQISPGFDRGFDNVTVTYAARALLRIAEADYIFLVSPPEVQAWLQKQGSGADDLVEASLGDYAGQRVLALVGIDGHWALVDYVAHNEGGAEATYVDGLEDRLWKEACEVGRLIHEHVSSGTLHPVKASCYVQPRDTTCGAVMLLHLGWRLGLWPAFSHADVQEWYRLLRWGLPKPTLFGGGRQEADDEALDQIVGNYLQNKGVPADQIASRLQEAYKALGKGKIAEAMRSKNPWQSLKSLGNNRARPFMWVKYDELRNHINTKSKEKWGAAVDIGKRRNMRKPQDERKVEEYLNPASLTLANGIFTDGKNDMPQIDFSAVRSGAIGVAFCKVEDAGPYIEVQKSISVGALMLLVLGKLPPTTNLKGVTVPAT